MKNIGDMRNDFKQDMGIKSQQEKGFNDVSKVDCYSVYADDRKFNIVGKPIENKENICRNTYKKNFMEKGKENVPINLCKILKSERFGLFGLK
jgi:hypothetical protein